MSRRPGFTLLELLVVVAILAIVVAAIGACLAAGMRVWDTARRYGRGEPQAALACAMIERDVVNSFRFHAISFSGSVDTVAMPALLGTGGADEAGVRRIGTVRYFLGPDGRGLLRKSWVYPEPEPPPEAAEVLAAPVETLQFRYAGAGAPADAWRDAWNDPSNMPWKVKVEIALTADAGGYRFDRTVVRPVTNGVSR